MNSIKMIPIKKYFVYSVIKLQVCIKASHKHTNCLESKTEVPLRNVITL